MGKNIKKYWEELDETNNYIDEKLSDFIDNYHVIDDTVFSGANEDEAKSISDRLFYSFKDIEKSIKHYREVLDCVFDRLAVYSKSYDKYLSSMKENRNDRICNAFDYRINDLNETKELIKTKISEHLESSIAWIYNPLLSCIENEDQRMNYDEVFHKLTEDKKGLVASTNKDIAKSIYLESEKILNSINNIYPEGGKYILTSEIIRQAQRVNEASKLINENIKKLNTCIKDLTDELNELDAGKTLLENNIKSEYEIIAPTQTIEECNKNISKTKAQINKELDDVKAGKLLPVKESEDAHEIENSVLIKAKNAINKKINQKKELDTILYDLGTIKQKIRNTMNISNEDFTSINNCVKQITEKTHNIYDSMYERGEWYAAFENFVKKNKPQITNDKNVLPKHQTHSYGPGANAKSISCSSRSSTPLSQSLSGQSQ
ncbi:MAG: coiled-coil domain-containing protein 22 [Pseudobutyrivibrio sp.]|nr:coiled-coil domain-containing protein 22 [Pseudobutyrivibrio sp.]